ncbi:hypothetical protein PFISCL1PPCAC_22560, partial [Pristionchus fissidentatus]
QFFFSFLYLTLLLLIRSYTINRVRGVYRTIAVYRMLRVALQSVLHSFRFHSSIVNRLILSLHSELAAAACYSVRSNPRHAS